MTTRDEFGTLLKTDAALLRMRGIWLIWIFSMLFGIFGIIISIINLFMPILMPWLAYVLPASLFLVLLIDKKERRELLKDGVLAYMILAFGTTTLGSGMLYVLLNHLISSLFFFLALAIVTFALTGIIQWRIKQLRKQTPN